MKYKNNSGIILVNVLVFMAIAISVTTAMVNWGATVLKTTRSLGAREQAFQIAEAGIEYYRWHLAHAAADYKDGTALPGPYVHTVKDASGDIIGQYSLTITPPPVGSTIVKVKSKGTITADASISRTLLGTLAIPSLAKFAVVANDDMRFGAGTEVFGPTHSNGGIRFDGVAHNLVTSSQTTYDDPDDGVPTQKLAVYTTVSPADPNPPAAVPNRPDVFIAGRQFPVQSFDFTGLTVDLSQMKASAQLPQGKYFASSGAQGYRIVLKTNDTFDLYKVNSLRSAPSGCNAVAGQTNWGLWSINNQTFVANYVFPSNGVIFVEDHLWIEGQIDGARLSIAAGKFPDNIATRKSITVNNDLLYTKYDGTDVIALIAQGDINAGLWSDNDLRIDGALIAQNGRVGRFYYSNSCSSTYYIRNTLTLYGMIATNQRYGFAYTDNTGYQIRNIIYDGNLLYGPPPSFPLTSSNYQTISWEEMN
jgi:hypothetical protein